MEPKNIADITLREMLVNMLGEENANKVLESVQFQYNQGIRGSELASFAESEIQQYPLNTDIRIPIAIIKDII